MIPGTDGLKLKEEHDMSCAPREKSMAFSVLAAAAAALSAALSCGNILTSKAETRPSSVEAQMMAGLWGYHWRSSTSASS